MTWATVRGTSLTESDMYSHAARGKGIETARGVFQTQRPVVGTSEQTRVRDRGYLQFWRCGGIVRALRVTLLFCMFPKVR